MSASPSDEGAQRKVNAQPMEPREHSPAAAPASQVETKRSGESEELEALVQSYGRGNVPGSTLVAGEADAGEIQAAVRNLSLYVLAAVLFGAGVFVFKSPEAGLEFFAAYLTEYSLSVDNLFVFLIIFNYFKVPLSSQPRVLNWGFLTAAVLRFTFLFVGTELLERFRPLFLVFAAVLLWNSASTLLPYFGVGEKDEDDNEDLADNQIVKFVKRFMSFSDHYDGEKFFTEIEEKDPSTGNMVLKTVATPLFLTLCVIELSDIVFATDSVPAVLGITQDVLVSYSSNLFAILGLRSLYFLLAEGLASLQYLEPAIGLVLGFIGGKICLDFGGFKIPTAAELAVVTSLLGSGVGLSLWLPSDSNGEEQRGGKDEEVSASIEGGGGVVKVVNEASQVTQDVTQAGAPHEGGAGDQPVPRRGLRVDNEGRR